MPLERDYLASVEAEYRRYRGLAERAIDRLSDEELVWVPDAGSNSVAVLMKHVGGNLRSRFADFLSSDGEKPDRDRDAEFEVGPTDVEAVRRVWERGWATLFATLEGLGPQDLAAVVRIRGEAHTVPQALERSVAHTAYHVGQIVYVAKHLRSAAWQTLSIARGQSQAFTASRRETSREDRPT